MIEIAFSSSFKRAYKKRVKGQVDLEEKLRQRIEFFIKNPFDGRLRTHRLSGKLDNLWSFSVDYDTRVIFHFIDENKVMFVDIGKHDVVY